MTKTWKGTLIVSYGFWQLIRQRTFVGQPFQADIIYPKYANLGRSVRLESLTYLTRPQSALSN
jgi:hypothetical protein